MGPISESNGTISFDVTVTNTGSVAGKDVVEVYYNPPYTNGGIEKASANLAAFDKTGLLEPGANQTLTLSFHVEDMASYDMSGAGGYVLERGDYIISINRDSHNIIDSQTYTVTSDIHYTEGRSTDQAAPVNLFDFAKGEIEYLSRADGFANFAAATAVPSMSMPEADKALFVNNSNYVIPTDPNAVMPSTGARNGMTVQELRGASYDDERWETLLDNLTISEMNNIIALGGYQTAPAASVGKVATTDCDGPAALNNNFTNVGSVGFPAGVMIACTWNEDLARSFGEGIADMAEEMNVSGWYAPAMNIHRTPFGGRNFEYYSEDGLLSGCIASQAASAASAGHPMAVMSSYNYIGTQWAEACDHLLNNVLRDEWGFRGSVLTDYFANFGYMDATRSIYNGGSSCLINRDVTTNNVTDTSNPLTVQQMRQACKDILFTPASTAEAMPPRTSTPA